MTTQLQCDVGKLFALSVAGLLAQRPLLVLPWFSQAPPASTRPVPGQGTRPGPPLQRANSAPPTEFARALAPSLQMRAAIGGSDNGRERRKTGRKMQKQRKLSLSAASALRKHAPRRGSPTRTGSSSAGARVSQGPPLGEGLVQRLARFFAIVLCAPIRLDVSDDARRVYLFGRETAFLRQLHLPVAALSGPQKRALATLLLCPAHVKDGAFEKAFDRTFLGVALCRAFLEAAGQNARDMPCVWQRAVFQAAFAAVAEKKKHLARQCGALQEWLRESTPLGRMANGLGSALGEAARRNTCEYMLLHGMQYWTP